VFGLLNPTVGLSDKISLVTFLLVSLGRVKNLTPASSIAASINQDIPWTPRGTTYPSSYILTYTPFSLSSSNIYKSSIICPSTHSRRVPDPYDCSVYHDCYHGTDLVSFCPAQLQYNSETQNCDRPQNVHCMNYFFVFLLKTFIQIGKNKCTITNEGARFIDPISCCHFHECKAGKLILQTCSHPDLFDIQTRKCLPYKQVKCDGRRLCLSKCKSRRWFLFDVKEFFMYRSLFIEL